MHCKYREIIMQQMMQKFSGAVAAEGLYFWMYVVVWPSGVTWINFQLSWSTAFTRVTCFAGASTTWSWIVWRDWGGACSTPWTVPKKWKHKIYILVHSFWLCLILRLTNSGTICIDDLNLLAIISIANHSRIGDVDSMHNFGCSR